MAVFRPGTGPEFRPATDEDFIYQLAATVGYNDFSASSSNVIIKDLNITRTTSDYSDPYYDIHIRGDSSGVVLSALDSTGVLDENNRLSRVSNGNCRVQANSFLKRSIINLDMTRINSNIHDELINYISGSLARSLFDTITTLIGSKTSESKPLFSTQNHTDQIYVRNVSSLASTINLTGISPWNSRGINTRAGTAITPRHIIQAAHYPLAVSDTIRFIASDNTVVTRTISGVQSIANDIQIALLDSNLPASISPLKLLPANILNYLPSLELFPVPVLATDYEENIFVKETCPNCWTNGSLSAIFRSSTIEPFSRIIEAIISGDSGNPIFMIINGAAVLVSHWQGVDVGPMYSNKLTEIAAAITTLGGGHSISTVDLSLFTDYS